MPGRLGLSRGQAPSAKDLESAATESERLRLVIRVRWFMIAALVAYSVTTMAFYQFTQPHLEVWRYLLVPAVALVLVSVYNAWYQLSYERLADIPYLSHFQILGDICVATVLVHYSGGVNSWFWTMYLLFSVEAAFILEEEGDTWLIGAFGTLVYGALLTLEYFNVIPSVAMPFIGLGLSHNFTYVMILWTWVVVMNGMVAVIGIATMRRLRSREEALGASAVYDIVTGLYDRPRFEEALEAEVERARRYRRTLSVLVFRIDSFRSYVSAYGAADGSRLVKLMADAVEGALRRGDGQGRPGLDIAARYSGEQLAVLAPEIDSDEAVALAERVREAVEAVCVPRRGSACRTDATVSCGIASYPADGTQREHLLAAAEWASEAAASNTVVLASELPADGALST